MATATSNKKYKLFSGSSSSEGGGKAPCAFFASPAGCRNGDSCKFAHVVIEQGMMMRTATDSSNTNKSPGSVVSSESGEIISEKPKPNSNNSNHSKPKDGNFLPFLPPGGRPAAEESSKQQQQQQQQQKSSELQQQEEEPASGKKKRKKRKKNNKESGESHNNPFANPHKKIKTSSDTTAAETTTTTTSPPKEQQQQQQQQQQAVTATSASKQQHPHHQHNKNAKGNSSTHTPPHEADFRSLSLPVAPFFSAESAPATTTPETSKEEKSGKKQESSNQKHEKEEKQQPKQQQAQPQQPPHQIQYPLPKSTESGRKWLGLVEQTRKHPRFPSMYDLSRFKKLDEEIGFAKNMWIKPKPFGSWCGSSSNSNRNPQVIALDCEMCETQDPVSGCKDPRALCRISIVDAETGEVLLDSLVKPNWPVVNYRTFVNGIAEEHLENVKFTLRHAQAFLLALCSEETVILGHSLQNDLAAMRMEHYCVVDSACLFEAKDNPEATVSLKDLASCILHKTMPEQHDSVNDANTALACLKHYLDKKGHVEKIERSNSNSRPNYGSQLFVHRIPKNCEESHISQMFLLHTSVQPAEVDAITFVGENGKTLVHFRSTRHANLAFDTLESKAETEASGRLQKKVFLRSGGYVRVRKMAFEKPNNKEQGSSNNNRESAVTSMEQDTPKTA